MGTSGSWIVPLAATDGPIVASSNQRYTTVTGSPFTNSGTQTFKNGSASGASAVNNSGGDADWVLVLEA